MSISQQKLGYKDKMYKVQLGPLQDVLKIDTEALEVTVEPNVTIGFLNLDILHICHVSRMEEI